MEEQVKLYIDQLEKRKLSKNTFDAYKRDIERFDAFLKDKNQNILEVDLIGLMSFVQELKRKGRAESSIVRNIVSLRNFYKYLCKAGKLDKNPIEFYEIPKFTRNTPEILTVEEMDKLLNMPDLSSLKGIRDKAMLEVMYACGLKVSELLNLKTSDINLKFNYVRCIGSKNKERIIPIGSYAVRCLENYLTVRTNLNVYEKEALFLNMHGEEMTRQGFFKIVIDYAKKAQINKHINTFTLRHSCAVHMIQNGADSKLIQELFGQTSLASAEIYSMLSKKSKLSDVYKNTHPRA